MNWFLLGLISALFSAAAAITQKKVLFKMSALEFSFIVSIFNLILSLPFFLLVDFSTLTTAGLAVLLFKSILGSAAFLCVMLAIKNLEISGALPLMVLTPGLVAFFAFLLIGESLGLQEITGMILLLIGTYILEMRSNQRAFAPFKVFYHSKFHHYIIAALLLFTTTSILDKVLLNQFKVTPYAFMGFQQLFFGIIFFGVVLFKKENPVSLFKKFDKSILVWVVLIAFLTIGYRYTQIEAIKIAPVALVLSVKRISVFIAAIVGGKLFKEKDLLKKSIATAIMVAGALLIFED